MSETVRIIPQGGRNSDGDPLPAGTPFDLVAWEIAPGNTLLRYGIGGDLDSVDFTAFLPLRCRVAVDADWQTTVSALTDDFRILVRGRDCFGRVQEWNSSGQGGVVVLCHSARGKGN